MLLATEGSDKGTHTQLSALCLPMTSSECSSLQAGCVVREGVSYPRGGVVGAIRVVGVVHWHRSMASSVAEGAAGFFDDIRQLGMAPEVRAMEEMGVCVPRT